MEKTGISRGEEENSGVITRSVGGAVGAFTFAASFIDILESGVFTHRVKGDVCLCVVSALQIMAIPSLPLV